VGYKTNRVGSRVLGDTTSKFLGVRVIASMRPERRTGVLRERLMAMTRDRGNIGYRMYLADAFGYLGYAAGDLGRGVVGGVDVPPFFLICLGLVAVVASPLARS
jgi:hypothetical protein